MRKKLRAKRLRAAQCSVHACVRVGQYGVYVFSIMREEQAAGSCDYKTMLRVPAYVPPVLPSASVSSGRGGGDQREVPVARL